MIEKLKKYDFISFDIFDTLIKRNVKKNCDIFKLVELEYEKKYNINVENYYNNRIDIEKKLRIINEKEEITFDDIYCELSKIYGKEISSRLKKIEEKMELTFCQKNLDLEEIYNWCCKNKNVIIISDMYFSKKFLKELLSKCNVVGYKNIYVSSEYNKTKRTGTLFEYVIDDLKINRKKIIHIGDNKKSDFLSAKKNGIAAIKISKDLKKCNHLSQEYLDNISCNIVNSFINNNILKNSNYFYKFGFENFGIILYSFCKWLIKELEKKNIKKVYFLARDGYIIQKAFDIVNESDIDSYYFYGSRRSLIVPSLWKKNNICEIFDSMFLPKKLTIKRFLKKVGLDEFNLEEKLFKYGLSLNTEINGVYSELSSKEKDFFNEIFFDIVRNSKIEYKNFINYVKKMKIKGKIAIVDIGWFGNMQKAMELLLDDIEIFGYYVGLIPEGKNQLNMKMKGFLFEKGRNVELYKKEHNYNSIFEYLFLAQHGSTHKYVNNDNGFELYEYEYKDSSEVKKIKEIQNGAIDFVKKFSTNKISDFTTIDPNIAMANLNTFALSPNLEDVNNFGDIMFYDDEISYIAKPKSKIYYVFHLKKLIFDYKNSKWRIGFMKRFLKLPLQYYKINNYIRKIYLKEN